MRGICTVNCSVLRRLTALLAVAALPVSPAAAFDTYWHAQCVQRVGEQFGFAESAWKIMQLGNFSPDFFGPVSEAASKSPGAAQLPALDQANDLQIRRAAIYLHFDNLSSDFHTNNNFDYLFGRLLQNTQTLLAGHNRLQVDDRTRNSLTLITLGASLHAVQDFYSHSDWVHNAFDQTGVKVISLPAGGVRAPTWFEFREKHKDAGQWPFQVQSGIYPPVSGARNTHTHMNHDNSRLMCMEPENPGPPLRTQAEYHGAGPVPARGDDASNLAHQQLAVNTAIAASIEWVMLVESNVDAKRAIEAARRWNVKTSDPHLVKELQAGLLTEMALSCVAGKWDGDQPPADRGLVCRSVLDSKVNLVGGSTGSKLESEIIGLAATFLMPVALRFTGLFWDIHGKYHILEHLTEDIGSDTGRYNFPKN
ncbi:MAG: hypothetical protein JWO80_4920 [Bryobacterales bacterium]|nr:hypothetical protein [Bryobacterales bacterium]